jgi:dihydroxy-acid dehydratase
MNSLAEALGMSLPGCAAIPAPHRDRQEMAYLTGKRSVELVLEDLRPSQVMTRAAFENAIVVCSAIGGSTNAPIQVNAIARHVGVELDNDDWERIGYDVPLLVNMQPAGEYLGEDYYRAGGVPAVVAELIAMGKIDPTAITVNGRTLHENNEGRFAADREVIRPHGLPLKDRAGFLNLKGNLFDTVIMTRSVISDEFRGGYLADTHDPMPRGAGSSTARGLPRPHRRSSLALDSLLVIRGVVGYPARPRWSHALAVTCSAASASSPVLATGASRERRAARRSSTLRRRPRPAAGSPSCGPATVSASTSADAPPTSSYRPESSRRGAPSSCRRAATPIRRARRRGRRSSAASSMSSRTAWC